MSLRRRIILPGTLLALLLFLLPSAIRAEGESAADDESTLKQAKVATDGPGLLEFFRKRTLSVSDRKRLGMLVSRLGSEDFIERQKASRTLNQAGSAAVPFLTAALEHKDPEVRSRAKECLAHISSDPTADPAVLGAAARFLAHRRPAGATAVLLRYLPSITDEALEEEIITSVGRVAVSQGKANAELTAALEGKSSRGRAAAAFLLGRTGGPDHREAVRRLLKDADPLVRRRAAEGLIGRDAYLNAEESAEADETLLKENKIATDAAGLTAFLRKRMLSNEERKRLQGLTAQLRDRSLSKRTEAADALIKAGTAALPFLRPLLFDPDLEVVNRARKCVEEIAKGPGTALSLTAVRLLVKRAPASAVKTLLAYVPSAEDDEVEEAVVAGLCVLAVRKVKLDPSLASALKDAMPATRAAAAHVLGRVGTRAECDAVRKLLEDADAGVRLRAAQGMVFARDRAAVPVLLALLEKKAPGDLARRAEEVLRQVAADKAPEITVASARDKAHEAWVAWWRDQGTKTDLSRLRQRPGELGLTILAEFDGGPNGQGQVWEFGRDFKPRWGKMQGLQGPMDAHVLPGKRVLIAEYYGRKVTERDLKGNIKWEHAVNGNPLACARMPNGNTFIATYTNVMEVTAQHKVVYDHNRAMDGQIYGAQKLRDGHVVYMTSAGWVVELDGLSGKVIHRFNVGNPGAWCGVERIGRGRYLVSLMVNGEVKEVDSNGKVYWKTTVVGAHQTLRLRNGHTLVVCMNNKQLVEVDRKGKAVWTRAIEGRPWRVHRR